LFKVLLGYWTVRIVFVTSLDLSQGLEEAFDATVVEVNIGKGEGVDD